MKRSKEHCHLEARDVGFEVSEFSTPRTSSAADFCLKDVSVLEHMVL